MSTQIEKLLADSGGCRSRFQIKLKTTCYVDAQYLTRSRNHSAHLSSLAKSLSAEMTSPANNSYRFMTRAKASFREQGHETSERKGKRTH